MDVAVAVPDVAVAVGGVPSGVVVDVDTGVVGVFVGVFVSRGVFVDVFVGVFVGVSVASTVAVLVGVGVIVGVGVRVGVGVDPVTVTWPPKTSLSIFVPSVVERPTLVKLSWLTPGNDVPNTSVARTPLPLGASGGGGPFVVHP